MDFYSNKIIFDLKEIFKLIAFKCSRSWTSNKTHDSSITVFLQLYTACLFFILIYWTDRQTVSDASRGPAQKITIIMHGTSTKCSIGVAK